MTTNDRGDTSHAEPAAGSSPSGPCGWLVLDRGAMRGDNVSALKIVAILLIVAGILGLVYGGITYTKSTHDAKVGPLEFSIKDKETVNIPVWAGVGAIVVGGALLVVRRKK